MKRKLILLYCSIFTAIAMMVPSCDFLSVDDYFSDEIKIDSVFNSKRNLEAYLWGIAAYPRDEGLLFEGGDIPGPLATDEAFTMLNSNGMRYVLGEITAANMSDLSSSYSDSYIMIRKANILLSRIDEVPDLKSDEKAEIIANARFLRAYAYYKLLVNYGPPIILGDEVMPGNESLEYYDRERSTYDEAVEYICGEFEAAARNLPLKLPIAEFGRPTKGAAYGLVARIRLYHASPLYNGGTAALTTFGGWTRKSDGASYVSQQYDESRWAVAAAAAKRVMDMTNGGAPMYELYTVTSDDTTPELPQNVTSDPDYYEPWPTGAAGIDAYRSYSEIFNGEAVIPSNKEYVWGRRSSAVTEATRLSFPNKNGGQNALSVTQKVVDAYRMADGRTIYDSSPEYPYSETGFTTVTKTFSGYRLNSGVFNMYNNREMRFYASIGFSECYWPMSSATSSGDYNKTITYYYDSANGKANNPINSTPTGYVIKKFIHPSDAWQGTNARRMEKGFGIIRYADILLMYAEALNNLTQTHTVELDGETMTVSRNPDEIKKAFNQVRHRAGLPGLSDADLADRDEVQRQIEQERMVEFLFENQRYYDVRRWGIYEKTEKETIMGMNVDGGKDTYYVRTVPNTYRIGSRVVNKKLTLLPIPLAEVRRLPSLSQNPGWES